MAIASPEIRLSPTERELLRLLGELLAGTPAINKCNLPPDQAVLSDREAAHLLGLIEELSTSRRFQENAYFVERLTKVDSADSDLREIYLSRRKLNGRSRAMASTHWHDFLMRLGFIKRSYSSIPSINKIPREMDVHHFIRMERVLLSQPGINPNIRAIIMTVVEKYASELDASRRGENPLPEGAIRNLPRQIAKVVKSSFDSPIGAAAVPATQVAGFMTIVADMSVLFSTRDWSVAGTMSTITGGFASATYR